MSATTTPGSAARFALSGEVTRIGFRLLAVALLCAGLAIASPVFATPTNIMNVLRQAALLFFMASGLTLVVLTAGLDLSIGAIIGLAACVAGTVMKATGQPALAVVLALGIGAGVGLFNGLLVAVIRIPSFIATYGMLWILQGLTYTYMAGSTVFGFPRAFRSFGNGFVLGVPIPVVVMVGSLVLLALFAGRTTWGQQVYAIGANPVAARLSGIPVQRRLILVYTLSGLAAGLAALVFLARLNSAEADIGSSLTLPAVAAVLIGGTSLFGGVGTLFGTFIGALLLTLVLNGMNLLQIDARWQPLVTGVIIVAAVWIDLQTSRRKA